MTDWQWQVILAMIRIILRLRNLDIFEIESKDSLLLKEALKRDQNEQIL